MKKALRITAAVTLALIWLLALAAPVFADQPEPDSTPTLIGMDVYRNLLETGDRLFIWESNTPYATEPDNSFPDAFIWTLYDTDNSTVLGMTTGYAYNSGGYGYNVFGMYFDAADNVTWGQAYPLRLSGKAGVFDDPPQYNYTVSAADYTALTDSDDNKDALALRILELALDLDNRWGLSTTYSLTLESELGTYLSIYGEAVFRGSIYGVQALAPGAFRLQVEDIDADDRTWDTEYSDNLSNQFTGTWVEGAKTGGGDLFGVEYDITSMIIAFILSILLLFANTKITSDHYNAFIDIGILLVALPRIDMIPLSFTALVCALFVLYEGTRVKSFVG